VLAACQPADFKTPDANLKLSVLLRDAQLDHFDNIKAGLSRIKAESLNELQSVRRSEQTCTLQQAIPELHLTITSGSIATHVSHLMWLRIVAVLAARCEH
jgi:hypothetical protein